MYFRLNSIHFYLNYGGRCFDVLIFCNFACRVCMFITICYAYFICVTSVRCQFTNRRRRFVYGLLFVFYLGDGNAYQFTLFRHFFVLGRCVMDLFNDFITAHLYLFLCLLSAALSHFRIFRLGFVISSFFITSEVCASICIYRIVIIRTARCVSGDIYLASVNGRLISRSFAFAYAFCRSNSVCSFCNYEGGPLKVCRFYRHVRAFVKGNGCACVKFGDARERVYHLYFHVQRAIRGYQLARIQ